MLYLKRKLIKKPGFEFLSAPTETSKDSTDVPSYFSQTKSYTTQWFENLCYLLYGVNLYQSHLFK